MRRQFELLEVGVGVMGIEYLEEFFKRVASEYGIPVEMSREGKSLKVSITADGLSREFLEDDNAVCDVVEVGENVEIAFNRRGEIRVSVYDPSSGWEDEKSLPMPDINIIGSEFEKNKDKYKYTILFDPDDEK